MVENPAAGGEVKLLKDTFSAQLITQTRIGKTVGF
jgi:hypothetical protein